MISWLTLHNPCKVHVDVEFNISTTSLPIHWLKHWLTLRQLKLGSWDIFRIRKKQLKLDFRIYFPTQSSAKWRIKVMDLVRKYHSMPLSWNWDFASCIPTLTNNNHDHLEKFASWSNVRWPRSRYSWYHTQTLCATCFHLQEWFSRFSKKVLSFVSWLDTSQNLLRSYHFMVAVPSLCG